MHKSFRAGWGLLDWWSWAMCGFSFKEDYASGELNVGQSEPLAATSQRAVRDSVVIVLLLAFCVGLVWMIDWSAIEIAW